MLVSWVRLDDRFPMHRKLRPITDAAFRLHVSGLCYAALNHTSGKIPRDDLALVSDVKRPAKAVLELEARGLWESTDTGWDVHDYLEYNPSAEEAQAVKDRRKKAGHIGGIASGRSRREANHEANASPTVDAVSKQTGSKSEPPAPTRIPTPIHQPPTSVDASPSQRAQSIAKRYTALEPMSNFAAVVGIARKAVDSARYTDPQISEAFERLAKAGRPVTVAVLKVELDGMPPPTSSTTNGRVIAGLELAARYEAQDTPSPLAIEG